MFHLPHKIDYILNAVEELFPWLYVRLCFILNAYGGDIIMRAPVFMGVIFQDLL
jgi:hypothetical protein